MNQYQRYKLRNDKIVADLKNDIRILIEEPDSLQSILIRSKYNWEKKSPERLKKLMEITKPVKSDNPHVTTHWEAERPFHNIAKYHAGLDPSVNESVDFSGFYRSPSEVVVKKKSVWWNPKTWLS